MRVRPRRSTRTDTPWPYSTLCRPACHGAGAGSHRGATGRELAAVLGSASARLLLDAARRQAGPDLDTVAAIVGEASQDLISEEHTSGPPVTNAPLVCRLLLEKKKTRKHKHQRINYLKKPNHT